MFINVQYFGAERGPWLIPVLNRFRNPKFIRLYLKLLEQRLRLVGLESILVYYFVLAWRVALLHLGLKDFWLVAEERHVLFGQYLNWFLFVNWSIEVSWRIFHFYDWSQRAERKWLVWLSKHLLIYLVVALWERLWWRKGLLCLAIGCFGQKRLPRLDFVEFGFQERYSRWFLFGFHFNDS